MDAGAAAGYGPYGPSMGQGMHDTSGYSTVADAAMLAESLESMVLGPGGPQMLQGIGPAGYYTPAGFAGHPAAAAAYGYALQPQHVPQQDLGRANSDRGPRPGRSRGGAPNGGAPGGPQQGERRGGGGGGTGGGGGGGGGSGAANGTGGGRKKRTQRGLEVNVRRTVYISYIDQQVTEESLANFFADCGTVMDCRICGDPNSAMRFAFIEFAEDAAAQKALSKTGSVLGSSPLRVLPSKTAIVPVNKELMPRTNDELERCSRTVYVANIDKKVDKEDVRSFFEQLCEFFQAEGAMAALNCSGALLGEG
ncbi:hypothetical protein MNEG_10868 [Monoraphidium neglectum]|uniref:RRM domain-containing protein n=1 Tax=Monoraphidium neglectum TaxID=145388 RepID=A0A0D2MR82_9CHLO|nr:hypothetical protein MNEG_10868 [Monoraphidium neglectum]KIY97095.1 hypothetical protein MNEG_10868 [Monoraphidium neglectum]|eukprot:XP_013896115.1 hypothetical protein MNEG_10868 [Monoraphidium neglectum]